MVKYYVILTVLLIFISFNCKGQDPNETAIIEEILNTPELQKFLHLNLKERTPLFILNNEHIDSLNVSEFKFEVILTPDTTGTNGNYIKLTKLTSDKNKAEFALYYKIENMFMSGHLRNVDGQWQMEKIDEIIEF